MLRYILSKISSREVFAGHPVTRTGRPRRGVSVVEVLFAIGVVAVGLLGVLALIPVAGARVTRGVIADAGDRLGRNAVREFHVRGMAEDGVWWQCISTSATTERHYEKFAPGLGVSFCIDPLFVAKHVHERADMGGNFHFFPSYLPPASPNPHVRMHRVNLAMGQAPVEWSARTRYVVGQFCQPVGGDDYFWYVVQSVSGTGTSGDAPPAWPPYTAVNPPLVNDNSQVYWRRVQPAMLFDEAMSTFMANDDLVFELPPDNALNPFQNFTRDADANAVKRQNQGSFSWMATLTPTSGVGENIYRLSAVVFHRRVLEADYERMSDIPNTEFHSARINGGDVTLVVDIQNDNHDEAKSKLQMKQGEWVMLFGPVGPANAANTNFRFRWYRVQMSDSGPRLDGTQYKRDLTLFGEDWPLETTVPWTKVLWIPGTIAVYERLVRLSI
jgi:hypothetical protein